MTGNLLLQVSLCIELRLSILHRLRVLWYIDWATDRARVRDYEIVLGVQALQIKCRLVRTQVHVDELVHYLGSLPDVLEHLLLLALDIDYDLDLIAESIFGKHKLSRDTLDRLKVLDVLHGDHIKFFINLTRFALQVLVDLLHFQIFGNFEKLFHSLIVEFSLSEIHEL